MLNHHTWFGPDIWYHLSWGRDILSRGLLIPESHAIFSQPVPANVYWFFQLITQSVYQISGRWGIELLFTGLWITVAILWGRTADVFNKSIFVGYPIFAAFIVTAQLRFDHRPEVFAYAALSYIIFVLNTNEERISKRDIVEITVAQIFMTNTHGYFALGPMLVGAWWLSNLRKTKTGWRLPDHGPLLFAAVGAGSFASPFFEKNWSLVFGYEKLGREMAKINSELFPTYEISLTPSMIVFWIFAMFVALALIFRLLTQRRVSFAILLALAGLYLGVRSLRGIPLFLLFSAPLIGELTLVTKWRRPSQVSWIVPNLFAIIGFCLCWSVWTGNFHRATESFTRFGDGLETSSYPIGAVGYLEKLGFRGRLFTDSYDGGYVEYQMPAVKIAGDSYFYDWPTTNAFFTMIKDPEALRAADRRVHFDALLVNIENEAVVDSYWNDPLWAFAYADSHRILFLRADEFPHSLITTALPKFYDGEDLRRWMNAYSVQRWMQIALRHDDRALAKKLIEDVSHAETLPMSFIRGAFLFALNHQDVEMARQLLRLKEKAYATSAVDEASIAQMAKGLVAPD